MKVVSKPMRAGAVGRWKTMAPTGAWARSKAASARACLWLALCLCLAACGAAAPADAPRSQAEHADAVALPEPLVELDGEGLRARAAQALREQRIHTPAGDSAVDYYLVLRDKEPGQIDVISALGELQPYVVIAGEQALLDDDLGESQRLLGLLERMDPQAPALPRLREGLRSATAARERKAREETQRLLAERADAAPAPRALPGATSAAIKADAAASALAADEAAARASTPAAPIASAPAPAASPPPAPATAVASAPARAMPRLIADASPRYPLPALNRKIEGSVEISFTILPDGRTGAARLVSSEPAGVFDDAALAAVARLRFEPSGQAHAARRTLNFKLPSR
ncbi:TonB family protein [Lysobacter capsici]|uniref:TonB family protein n=1 Tax=Lysobacter capsici TaxID=435897 RepID=UPI0012FD8870|nr:TonB family protein [Lysobacter capsici]